VLGTRSGNVNTGLRNSVKRAKPNVEATRLDFRLGGCSLWLILIVILLLHIGVDVMHLPGTSVPSSCIQVARMIESNLSGVSANSVVLV
jgi:hypothetical protein